MLSPVIRSGELCPDVFVTSSAAPGLPRLMIARVVTSKFSVTLTAPPSPDVHELMYVPGGDAIRPALLTRRRRRLLDVHVEPAERLDRLEMLAATPSTGDGRRGRSRPAGP
jgi:hypothetical protein